MADYPARGTLDWDDDLKNYIDGRDDAVLQNQAINIVDLTTVMVAGQNDRYTKAASDARYATTAQGSKADTAIQAAALTSAINAAKVNTTLATGTDLNTVQATGNYNAFSGTLALNFPVEGYSGALRVDSLGSGSILQSLVAHSGGGHVTKVIWQRRLNGGTWSAWSSLVSNRFLAAGSVPGVEAFVYDPSATVGIDRQLQVIQQTLGSADLNTITYAGSYLQATNTLATFALNYPKETVYGVLDVQRLNSQNVTQTFTTIASAKAVWRRRLTSNVWEPWEQMSLNRFAAPATGTGMELFLRDGDAALDRQVPLTAMTLTSTDDLNAVIALGTYKQAVGSNATLALNYPLAGQPGALEVLPTGTTAFQIQRYTPFNFAGYGFFIRTSAGLGTWGAWRWNSSSRFDKTAGLAIYQYDPIAAREQLIYGDTGWRDISALITNGWTGAAFVRRVGATVEIQIGGVVGTAATSNVVFSLGSGFRGVASINTIFRPTSTTAVPIYSSYGSNGDFNLPAPNAPITGGRHSLLFTTTEPWPTALPGIASGSIPNL